MKKLFYSIGICLVAILVIFMIAKTNKKSDLTKVKVGEVTHSVFYAPQYVAHKLGYFEDEKLDVEIILVSGVKSLYVFLIFLLFTCFYLL